MDGVKKVQKARVASVHHAATMNHQQRVQKSTTLNRRFVKKPSLKVQPRISASAAAAAKSLRRSTAQPSMITKKNSVRLSPVSAEAKVAEKQIAARKTAHASVGRDAASQQQVNLMQSRAQAAQQAQRRQQVAAKAATQQAGAAKAQAAEQASQYQKHELAKIASARMKAQKAQPARMSAQEMKERAIQQALRKMNTMEQQAGQKNFAEAKQKKNLFQNKKFVAATVMAVLSISVLGYLVYLNMPDISVRVAAMQAGIERSYPSFVPLSYRLDGLVKEDNGRITMNFKNSADGNTFTLTEEKTSWDSAAVLTNYVKKNWGGEYTIAKGQGLTIYISGSNAAWVNGGVLYVIEDATGTLKSSDLHDIAVSL